MFKLLKKRRLIMPDTWFLLTPMGFTKINHAHIEYRFELTGPKKNQASDIKI
jgi:hypothetical protein